MTARIRNFEQGIQLCWWILLAVVVAVVVFIRIHLLAVPLERDEGEYAYAGQLILQGIPPYRLAYNRSEEHTSELQSLRHLVCRLLLVSLVTVFLLLSLHDALPISYSIF